MISHPVSHSLISTALDKPRSVRVVSEVSKPSGQMPCSILFTSHVWQQASHGTCMQCVQMGHSQNGQSLD